MSIVYGHDISQTDDPFIEVAEKASMMRGILLTPGKFPISQLPFARYFPSWAPGCGFKQIAHLSREYTKEAQAKPFNFAMEQKVRWGRVVEDGTDNFIVAQRQRHIFSGRSGRSTP